MTKTENSTDTYNARCNDGIRFRFRVDMTDGLSPIEVGLSGEWIRTPQIAANAKGEVLQAASYALQWLLVNTGYYSHDAIVESVEREEG